MGSRRMLCSSLISSGVEYCISAWYPGLLEDSKNALAILQQKMVRFVTYLGPREHVADAEIISLGWLSFSYLCTSWRPDYHSLLVTLPEILFVILMYGPRQSNINFSLSSCQFPVGSFTRTAIAHWNSLPIELKHIQSLAAFRRRLIAFLKSR